MDWTGRRVLVTGGASFIGSHLVDALVERGAWVHIVDDLSSGRLDNIWYHLGNGRVELMQADLKAPGVAHKAVEGISIVFHLSADHGGRGYVDLHQAACATNLMLDGIVFGPVIKPKSRKSSTPPPAASISTIYRAIQSKSSI
jgi:nucleoside-diphosphate-sugar epimerase